MAPFKFFIPEPQEPSRPIVTPEGVLALVLLVVLSLAAFFYHLVRIHYDSPIDFSMDWNLFLSWIPVLIAFSTRLHSRGFPEQRAITILLSVGWLLFFPNAPYMVTDLIHLSVDYNRDLTWHDTIMLFYYAQVSLINGIVSMYWMHRSWQRVFSYETGNWLLFISLPLGGFGIYLGRIIRLNSWDVVSNPVKLMEGILEAFTDRTAIILSLEFALLLGMLYAFLWFTLHLRVRIHNRTNNQ